MQRLIGTIFPQMNSTEKNNFRKRFPTWNILAKLLYDEYRFSVSNFMVAHISPRKNDRDILSD